MTKEQKAILIAISIGDGYLKKDINSKSVLLKLLHSIKQKEYLIWKVNLVRKICGGKENKIVEFNNNGYLGIYWSKANDYFRVIRKWLYKDRKKVLTRNLLNKLTPMGIAIWYMDDGCLSYKKRNGKIHARELTLNTYLGKEENEIIIKYFKEKWDLRFGLNKSKGKYRLRMGTHEAKRFIELVKPYIIPSMQYKIDMKYN